MHLKYDMAFVGSGPAGTSAAITAASRGLRVLLLDRVRFPRLRPGECLHPGIEPIFRELRVWHAVAEASAVRPEQRRVCWDGGSRLESFGQDAKGGWRAVHITRSVLDAILLQRARDMGVEYRQAREEPLQLLRRSGGDVDGVIIGGAPVQCRYLVDASGSGSWLNRQLGVAPQVCSPKLTAFCGYREGHLEDAQRFYTGVDGWYWFAQVDTHTVNWTQVKYGVHTKPCVPAELSGMPAAGPSVCGFDVTWRRAGTLAGQSYFVTGDAAFVLDPSAGNGVLHAVLSGIFAGECVVAVTEGRENHVSVQALYHEWSSQWFDAGRKALAGVHGQQWSHRIGAA